MFRARARISGLLSGTMLSGLIAAPRRPRVAVGFPAGKASGSIIEVAVWQEFGTSRGIPERPFMRNAMRNNLPKYKDALGRAASRIAIEAVTGKGADAEIDKTLEQLGIMAQGDIQDEITSLQTPPNAPSTIRKKGSSNPLIDTGAMSQAVTYKVET